MLNICLNGSADPRILDQWGFVLSHWTPDKVYLLGGPDKLDTRAFRGAVRVATAEQLPGVPLVLFSPKDARYTPGVVSLPEFRHPPDATYMFGSNKTHLSSDDLGMRVPDHRVYIPTDTHHELYDFVAAAIALWDRRQRHG